MRRKVRIRLHVSFPFSPAYFLCFLFYVTNKSFIQLDQVYRKGQRQHKTRARSAKLGHVL